MKKTLLKKGLVLLAIVSLLGSFIACDDPDATVQPDEGQQIEELVDEDAEEDGAAEESGAAEEDPEDDESVAEEGAEEESAEEEPSDENENAVEEVVDEGEDAAEEEVVDEDAAAEEAEEAEESEEAAEEESGVALNAAAGWWVNMLDADVKVDANSSVVMKFTVDDVIGTDNWSTPDIYLLVETAGEDGALTWVSDVAVTRTDNFGFLGDYNTFANNDVLGWTLDSNWDWDNFLSNIEGAEYTVTVKNYGATADVLMNVKASNGSEFYQNYKGITVSDSDNLYIRVTGDEGAWTGTFYGTESAALSE